MTKVRKKIGNIPINTIKQDLQSTVDASVAQMQQDVTDFIDEETAQYPEIGGAFKFQTAPEYASIETDSEGRILGGRRADGTKFENIGFESAKVATDNIEIAGTNITDNVDAIKGTSYHEDPEGRSEITTDSKGKIISYRDKDGTLVENVGIKAKTLNLSKENAEEIHSALDNAGYNAKYDLSNDNAVQVPFPRVCAKVNIITEVMPTLSSQEFDGYIEFWDKDGNYFKKPIEALGKQGDTSGIFPYKNYKFDIADGSTIKFGNLVAQDSFHLKKYYVDVFRGQCVVAYRLFEQVCQNRGFGNIKPYDYLNKNNKTLTSNGKFANDFDTGALCHPDGFPIMLYHNGELLGLYAFMLKKHRDNYAMKKGNVKHILLDGTLGQEFWRYDLNGYIQWNNFEIRNPKTKKKKDGWELVDINGDTYDGDNPKELMGSDTPGYDSTNQSHVNSAKVKNYIVALADTCKRIADADTDADKKEIFEERFNIPYIIDYFVTGQYIYDKDGFIKNWIWGTWDGVKWSPTYYDKDTIFGAAAQGNNVQTDTDNLLGTTMIVPSKILWELYRTEIIDRYNELKAANILTADNIVRLLNEWLDSCGYDNLKKDIEDCCTDMLLDANGNLDLDENNQPKTAPCTPSYRKSFVADEWELIGTAGSNNNPYDSTHQYAEGDTCTYQCPEGYNHYSPGTWIPIPQIFRAKQSVIGVAPMSGFYAHVPSEAGYFNSAQRVYNWIQEHEAYLDTIFTNN